MNYKKILIVKLSSLGDIIHTLPAFEKIKRNFPGSKIGWVVEKKGAEILSFIEGIDEIIIFDTFKWRRNPVSIRTFLEIKESIKKIRKKYDVALDFQGTIKSAFITFLSYARERIGFNKKNLRESLSSIFYTKKAPKVSDELHVILKNLKLLETIGLKDDSLELPKIKINADLPDELTFDKESLIIINGGGGWETKRWIKGRWRELGLKLKEMGFQPLFLWGNSQEKKTMEEESKGDVPIAPPLSLSQVMKLISSSILVVSGDTFPLHVAEVLRVPAVGIFGPSSPFRNGPISRNSKVIFHRLPCSFCYKRKCKNLECMKKIEVENVLEKIKEILGK